MSTTTTTAPSLSEEARVAWSEQKKNAYLVLATLLMMTAFQMGMSPPGGLWSEDSSFIKEIIGNALKDPENFAQAPQPDESIITNWGKEIAGGPMMARNCESHFHLFNLLNHSILLTSALATAILLSKADADSVYVKYSTVALGLSYCLVSSCFSGLAVKATGGAHAYNIKQSSFDVAPWFVGFVLAGIFCLQWKLSH